MNQLLRADRQVWIFLSQNVTEIRPGADNKRPLDKALDDALMDYNVAFHLLPLPTSQSPAYAPVRKETPAASGAREESGYKGAPFNKGQGQIKGLHTRFRRCSKRNQRSRWS